MRSPVDQVIGGGLLGKGENDTSVCFLFNSERRAHRSNPAAGAAAPPVCSVPSQRDVISGFE